MPSTVPDALVLAASCLGELQKGDARLEMSRFDAGLTSVLTGREPAVLSKRKKRHPRGP